MANVRIRLRDDGPLVIDGQATIVDAEGNTFPLPTDKSLVALCRCGHSDKKPFCDGSHKRCGFNASERAVED
jgi:CDGSH iron-sulfur domain-containing protein 3